MIESIVTFFETIPSWQRTALLIAGLVSFWALEGAIPLFTFRYHKIRHAALNLFFTLTTLIVNFTLAFLIIKACDFTTSREFGLLNLVQLPLWLHVTLGVLLLDFIGAYLIHWIEHQIKWMWKFHLIHHTDTKVDITTALRHHPGESVFRALFTTLAVIAAGVPVGVVLLYQAISVLFAQLTHANIRTPARLDQLLSYVFVTPKMHKVHHHFKQPLTDTNYGNIFSLWDRLFGTFAEVESCDTLKYGIDTHMQTEENSNLKTLLGTPFRIYKTSSTSKFNDRESEA